MRVFNDERSQRQIAIFNLYKIRESAPATFPLLLENNRDAKNNPIYKLFIKKNPHACDCKGRGWFTVDMGSTFRPCEICGTFEQCEDGINVRRKISAE